MGDLAVSRGFYVDGLDWEPAFDGGEEVVMIYVGDRLVLSLWAHTAAEQELGPVSRGHGAPPFTLAHNVASPAEVDAVLDTARRAGATTVEDGVRRDWGGYSGYFADPDGFRWEVAHNPFPIGHAVLP